MIITGKLSLVTLKWNHLSEISGHSRSNDAHHVGSAVGDPKQRAGEVGGHVEVDAPRD